MEKKYEEEGKTYLAKGDKALKRTFHRWVIAGFFSKLTSNEEERKGNAKEFYDRSNSPSKRNKEKIVKDYESIHLNKNEKENSNEVRNGSISCEECKRRNRISGARMDVINHIKESIEEEKTTYIKLIIKIEKAKESL